MTPPRKNRVSPRLPSEAQNSNPDADRRLRQADRLARIMRMLQLLLSRGRWNARDIAAEQECSERTIYRDKQVLELAGIPVETDKNEKCYRIRPDFRFPSLNITEEEAVGQATAAALTESPGLNINSGARPVTRKLAATSTAEVAEVLADAEELIAVLDLKLADHSRHREIIRTIQAALFKGKQVTGTYRSPYESTAVKLHLHPYRLCLVKQAWYLIGCPVSEHSPRTYRVARFKTLRMQDSNSLVPDNFDLKDYFGNAWAVYRGEQRHAIEIVFTPEAGTIARETVWHPTQKVHKNRDGSVTFHFQVDGLNEIVRWILGWGNRVKVIQPPELRKMVIDQLQQTLRAYESNI